MLTIALRFNAFEKWDGVIEISHMKLHLYRMVYVDDSSLKMACLKDKVSTSARISSGCILSILT